MGEDTVGLSGKTGRGERLNVNMWRNGRGGWSGGDATNAAVGGGGEDANGHCSELVSSAPNELARLDPTRYTLTRPCLRERRAFSTPICMLFI
jgi:hypothetical protein